MRHRESDNLTPAVARLRAALGFGKKLAQAWAQEQIVPHHMLNMNSKDCAIRLGAPLIQASSLKPKSCKCCLKGGEQGKAIMTHARATQTNISVAES